MRLNHLDLPVRDIDAARQFFERHFGFRCLHAVPARLAVLADRADFRLVLSAVASGASPDFPSGFHIGFLLPTDDAVHECHARLAADAPIVRPLGRLAGAPTFHCHAPGPVPIEISCRAPGGPAPG